MFDLVIMVDWSAAASPGPVKETKDRCWLAWATQMSQSDAEYFRTRHSCMTRIKNLLEQHPGNAMVGFDFPFGYPAKCGMGGGRNAAHKIASVLISDEHDGNNRFEVAAQLNAHLSGFPGPFWGCPARFQCDDLTQKKPPFKHHNFQEWRIVEKYLREERKMHSISEVWKLYTTGSVGSQTLTGLKELHNLSKDSVFKDRIKFWPYETEWAKDLNGIILTEIWPSLNNLDPYNHSIKDARQVLACRDWFKQHMTQRTARQLFGPPDWLSSTDRDKCRDEEGWILGVS